MTATRICGDIMQIDSQWMNLQQETLNWCKRCRQTSDVSQLDQCICRIKHGQITGGSRSPYLHSKWDWTNGLYDRPSGGLRRTYNMNLHVHSNSTLPQTQRYMVSTRDSVESPNISYMLVKESSLAERGPENWQSQVEARLMECITECNIEAAHDCNKDMWRHNANW